MQIKLYEAESGRSPVLEFLLSQQPDVANRLRQDINHLQTHGLDLMRSSKMKKLRGQTDVYELRTPYRGVAYRILFTIVDGVAWLLHGFPKKTQHTPIRHVRIAIARRGELLRLSK